MKPLLELLGEPIYECRRLEFPRTTFLVNPAKQDLLWTNMAVVKEPDGRGHFPAPNMFEACGIVVRFPENCPEKEAWVRTNCFIQFKVGDKDYLTCPVRYAADEAYILDLRIAEERIMPRGNIEATGRMIPLHIPSSQRFHVDIVAPEGPPDPLREQPPLVDVIMWGVKKRRV